MVNVIQKMRTRDERGFTLVELLIVIAIIAILAAIAIPQFSSYRQRGIRATMVSDAKNTATVIEAFAGDFAGSYPGSVTASAAVPGSTFIMGTQTGRMSQGNGLIVTGTYSSQSGYYIQVYNVNAGSGSITYYQDNTGLTSWSS